MSGSVEVIDVDRIDRRVVNHSDREKCRNRSTSAGAMLRLRNKVGQSLTPCSCAERKRVSVSSQELLLSAKTAMKAFRLKTDCCRSRSRCCPTMLTVCESRRLSPQDSRWRLSKVCRMCRGSRRIWRTTWSGVVLWYPCFIAVSIDEIVVTDLIAKCCRAL